MQDSTADDGALDLACTTQNWKARMIVETFSWHATFARTGQDSIVKEDPLDKITGVGIEVEYFACEASHNRRFICLMERGDTGIILRREVNLERVGDDLISAPVWEGELRCNPSFVRSVVSRLAKMGLWELHDCRATQDLLDGEWYAVRAKGVRLAKENAFVLYCPEQASDPRCRRIAKQLSVLLATGRRAFAVKAWLGTRCWGVKKRHA